MSIVSTAQFKSFSFEREFPCIKKGKQQFTSDEILVLFPEPNCGTVLFSTDDRYTIGCVETNFEGYIFSRYGGEIVLRNG